MTKVDPVRGWALDRIVELDRLSPGVAGSFLRASPERRQIVASLLAAERNGPSAAPVNDIPEIERARMIANADHRAILVAGYGVPPLGMRGALSRAGSQPHAPRFYSYLYHLLATPRCQALVPTIAQLPRLNMVTLKIARLLPPDLHFPALISMIEDVETAKDIKTLTALMATNGIEREALAEALRRVDTRKQLAKLWMRWSLKMVFPDQPVLASRVVQPVTSAAELRRIGLKYHNCAERYITEVLEGRAAFCEFIAHERSLVVHLRKVSDRWVIEDVHASHNGSVRRDARVAVIQHFAELGIFERSRRRPMQGDWSAMRRLTTYYEFEDGDDEE